MPKESVSLLIPPTVYTQKDEVQFRRDLEAKLTDLYRRLDTAGLSPRDSLASKRENLLAIPIGIREYS